MKEEDYFERKEEDKDDSPEEDDRQVVNGKGREREGCA